MPSTQMLLWMWRDYLRAETGTFIAAGTFMAMQALAVGATSWIVMPMFDRIFVGGERDAIPWIASVVAAIYIVRAVANLTQRILLEGIGLRVLAHMQADLMEHLLTLDPEWFRRNSPGTLIDRVRGDTQRANFIWTAVFARGFQDVVTAVALIGVALSIDWVWTFTVLAGVPLLLGPIQIAQRYVRKTSRAAREASARLSVRLDEVFHGVDTIKLSGSERRETGRFGKILRHYLGREMKSRVGQATIPALTDIVAGLGFAVVIMVGGRDVISGDKTVGEFMAFFTAIGLLLEPVRRIANLSGQWQVARASLERVRFLFDARPQIVSPARPTPPPEAPEQADIVFDDVHVAYGDHAALKGASFTARAGEVTALVGPSGAGKSTVFNVLTRLVDPASGRITIGGIDIREMELARLRALFGVVSQEAPMFDESLRENVVLNTESADEERLATALKAAFLTETIEAMPRGIDTQVGPRGSALSGGQRQRVAIARAVLRDAPILLLDEATSALDAESEAHVQEALESLAAGRTTLVIAHRLSTIRDADRIVVLDQGRVVETGRHEDLLAAAGLYAGLHALQLRGDEAS